MGTGARYAIARWIRSVTEDVLQIEEGSLYPALQADMTSAMRDAIRTIDPSLPLYDVRRMDDVIVLTRAGRRFNMLLLSFLGTAGLVLAAVGIYGVIGFFVMQRTHEIGVRMALGANCAQCTRPRSVPRRPSHHDRARSRRGAVVCRDPGTRIHAVRGRCTDPITFVTGALVLAIAAILAVLIPARRATRVEPLRSSTGS